VTGNPQGVEHSLLVARASGMVSVQAGCTCDEAVALMVARAAAQDQTLMQVAEAVLDRTTSFGF
jgi:AmiR/NasT family two-component response regulator